MTNAEIRRELHEILNAHDAVLDAMRQANGSMGQATQAMSHAIDAHDAALVSAIEANRAALRLLNKIMEGDQR